MARLAAVMPAPGPMRPLAAGTLLSSIGRGMFMTAAIVFFVRSVGLSAAQVGVGLTIAGAVGAATGIPAGHLADRYGQRGVTVVFMLIEGLVTFGFAVVHTFTVFLVVACVAALAREASGTAWQALIGSVAPSGGRAAARAYLRSTKNAGIAVGALFAGVALAADTRAGYLALVFGAAVSYVVSALLTLAVPAVPPAHRPPGEPRLRALRDRPYLSLSALNAVLCIHNAALTVAVPLWVVERTTAPQSTIAAIMLLATMMVVLFQVRASRGSEDVRGAARAQRRAGLLLLGACAVYALSAGQPAWVAVAILLAGAFLHVLGELAQAAGSWGLSYELAPDHAHGQYQGVYNTGLLLANMVTPAFATALVVWLGWPGWLVLGGLFAAAGLAVPPVARWAERSVRAARPDPAGSPAASPAS